MSELYHVPANAVSRRLFTKLLTTSSLGAVSGLLIAPRTSFAAASVPVSFQNILNFGADPTGNSNSAPAFDAAFSALPSNGGTIFVPDGDFRLDYQVNFCGKPVTVLGNGEQSSRIFITHTGVALGFYQPSPLYMSSVKNLSISAVSSTPAAGAIAINFPPFPVYGSQTALVENVAVPGQLYAGKQNFVCGLQLMGCWQSVVRNFKHNAAGGSGPIPGSFFIQIGGRSIDIRITDCTGTNSDLGINLPSYTEGIHIQDTAVVSSNVCVSMSPGFDQYESTQQYSTMGLTMAGCEFVANKWALSLDRVLSAYIENSHFALSNTATNGCVVGITDSQDVKISDCTISGTTSQTGIGLATVSYPCYLNEFNNNYYVGVSYPIVYTAGVVSNTATGIRWNPNGNSLTNSIPVFDKSGNTTNNAQWLNRAGQPVWAH